jgi:hypothetical protein
MAKKEQLKNKPQQPPPPSVEPEAPKEPTFLEKVGSAIDHLVHPDANASVGDNEATSVTPAEQNIGRAKSKKLSAEQKAINTGYPLKKADPVLGIQAESYDVEVTNDLSEHPSRERFK